MSRMERINQQMKREISNIILQDLQDPRLEFVSITEVSVSPDFKNARIGFSVLGPPENVGEVELVLRHAASLVRKMVGERINLRHTPRINFVYDPSIQYSIRVEEALEEIKESAPFDYLNASTDDGSQDDELEDKDLGEEWLEDEEVQDGLEGGFEDGLGNEDER